MIPLIGALFATLAFLVVEPAHASTLVYSNDVMGDIEPCGCRTNPLGGMARKSGLLKTLKDPSILQLDAGDLLFGTVSLPDPLRKQAELQAGYVLRSADLIHQDAAVPGEKDFVLGVKTFDQLRKSAKIVFLAANLSRKNGKPFLKPYEIFLRKTTDGKNQRIAVLGLVGSELDWPKELKASSPIARAKLEIPKLRKKADLIIALTHEGYDADLALAKAVPDLDIIVGGHSQSFLQTPVKVGKTLVLQSSFRNQYVGILPLEKPIKSDEHRLVGLDAGYDPDALPEMNTLVIEFKKAVADLNIKETSLTQIPSTSHGENGKFQTFPHCAECHLKQFDFWRKTNHALAFHALVGKQQSKNQECLSCHTVGLWDPQGFKDVTRLAEAKTGSGDKTDVVSTDDLDSFLKSMHDVKTLNDEVKIRQVDSKAVSLRNSLNRMAKSWTPVQCENCHQPGLNHPFSSGYTKKVENTTCLKCHTPEQAPEWYRKSGEPDLEKITQKRAMVTCPAGELPPED